MNFQLPAPNVSQQWHPCPNCNTSTRIEVITAITSYEDFTHFMAHRLNRAQCFSCGAPVEAPVRVSVKITLDNFPEHECVPLVLLKNPDVLDDLLNNTPPGLIRVYSCDELERAIEACCRLEFRRQGITPEEITPGEVFVAPDR
jgi:hypothetical protein